jgi:hypothetical protein
LHHTWGAYLVCMLIGSSAQHWAFNKLDDVGPSRFAVSESAGMQPSLDQETDKGQSVISCRTGSLTDTLPSLFSYIKL